MSFSERFISYHAARLTVSFRFGRGDQSVYSGEPAAPQNLIIEGVLVFALQKVCAFPPVLFPFKSAYPRLLFPGKRCGYVFLLSDLRCWVTRKTVFTGRSAPTQQRAPAYADF